MTNEELRIKAKTMLFDADNGSTECKHYNNGFLDGLEYAMKELSQPNTTQINCEHNWKYLCGSVQNKTHKCTKCGAVG